MYNFSGKTWKIFRKDGIMKPLQLSSFSLFFLSLPALENFVPRIVYVCLCTYVMNVMNVFNITFFVFCVFILL